MPVRVFKVDGAHHSFTVDSYTLVRAPAVHTATALSIHWRARVA